MKIKILFLLLIISIIFNIVLLGEIIKTKKVYAEFMNDYTTKKHELDEKSNAIDKELEKLFDHYYSDKLKKFMDEEDLIFLAQRQWNYVLTANGNFLDKNTIYTEDKNIKIVLEEFCNKEKILPEDILIKGTLTEGDPKDSLDSHLNISSLIKYNKHIDHNKYNKRICYEFKDIPKGTIISIKLSELLKYKLNLNNTVNFKGNKIEIIVN